MSVAEKKRVVALSVMASLFMTLTKFGAGLFTGSLGLMSEAVHSLIDLAATIVTWFAVRWSDAPPDDDHHYGHAKAESLAALIETALLFLTTAWIIYEAVKRLMGGAPEIEITWWAIGIVVLSIVIDFNRARSLKRVAEKTGSEALEADALHFSSDMWSSLCVLVGLGFVWLGFPYADAIAALIVSAFVAHAGWELGQRTLGTLLDTAPVGATAVIRDILNDTTGILQVKTVRLRPAGPVLFTSIVFEVPRTMPVDEIVRVKAHVTDAIMARFPNADLTVTANPVALDDETVFQKVSMIASHRGMNIHHLTVQDLGGRLAISFDLEFDGAMTLAQAHDHATNLENAIRQELGPDVEVESHIEPQPERHLTAALATPQKAEAIINLLTVLTIKAPELHDLHNIRVRENDQGLFVHYHCRFAPQETVDKVHDILDRIENGLQDKFPRIKRVIAHAEPLGYQPHRL